MQILYQRKKCQIKNTLHAKVREATFRHLLNGVSRIPVFCKSTFATFCTDFSDVGNVTLKTCQKFAYCTFKFGAYSLNSFKQDNIDPDQSKIKSIALRLHKIKKRPQVTALLSSVSFSLPSSPIFRANEPIFTKGILFAKAVH